MDLSARSWRPTSALGRGVAAARWTVVGALVVVALGLAITPLVPEHLEATLPPRVPAGAPLVEFSRSDLRGLEILSVYGAVATATEAGLVLVAPDVPMQASEGFRGLNELLLHGLAGVHEVRVVEAARSAAPPVGVAPDLIGETLWGSYRWRMWLAGDGARILVVSATTDGDLQLIDGRLLPGVLEVVGSGGIGIAARADAATLPAGWRPPVRPDGPVAAIVLDALVLLLLMLAGGLVLPTLLGRALRVCAGLLVGVAALAVTGLFRPPAGTGLLLVPSALGLIGHLVRRSGTAIGWNRGDLPLVAGAAAALLALATTARSTGLLRVASDEVLYLAGARAMTMGELAPELLDPKRGIALQALHAPSMALGVDGLQSLGAALLFATVGLLVAIPLSRGHVPAGVVVLAAALVALSPGMRAAASLVNSHLLVGALLMLVAAVPMFDPHDERATHPGGPAPAGRPHPLAPMLAVAAAAIVLLRPEGVLLLALVLAAAAPALRTMAAGAWTAAWRSGGAALILWHGLIAAGVLARSGSLPSLSVGSGAVGIAMVAAPTVLAKGSLRLRQSLAPVMLAALWVLTVGVTLSSGGRTTFWAAASGNLLEARGGWGILAPAVIALLVVGVTRAVSDASADTRVLGVTAAGFVPIVFLAKLLDTSGGRVLDLPRLVLDEVGRGVYGAVGWGDSTNRMWTHVVPTVVLLAVATLGRRDRADCPTRGIPARAPRVAAVLLLLALTSAWSPQIVLPERRSVPITPAAAVGHITGELVRGTTVSQRVRPAPAAVLAASELGDREVCLVVQFGTFGRRNPGQLRIEIEAAGSDDPQVHSPAVASAAVATTELEDNAPRRLCVPLDGPVPTDLDVRVIAEAGEPGASPVVWVGAPGPLGTAIEHRPDGTLIAHGPVLQELRIEGSTWTPARTLTRILVDWGPRVAVVLLAAGLLMDRRPAGGLRWSAARTASGQRSAGSS